MIPRRERCEEGGVHGPTDSITRERGEEANEEEGEEAIGGGGRVMKGDIGELGKSKGGKGGAIE